MLCVYCGHETDSNDECSSCGMCPRCGCLGGSLRCIANHRSGSFIPRHARSPIREGAWAQERQQIIDELRAGGNRGVSSDYPGYSEYSRYGE